MDMTKEDIDRQYNAALDSVNLIANAQAPEVIDLEWINYIKRNVDHLKIMVSKDFWIDHDLTPMLNAITTGESLINAASAI